jgi:hypothetical protein
MVIAKHMIGWKIAFICFVGEPNGALKIKDRLAKMLFQME